MLGLISLLMALLAPAVQRARESARTMTCRNNLKQLGLALGQYEAQFHWYPLAVRSADVLPDGEVRVYAYSVTAIIVPWLDQKALAKRLDMMEPFVDDGPKYEDFIKRFPDSLPVLHCPSDAIAVGPSSSYSYSTGVCPRIAFGFKLEGAFARVAVADSGFS